MPRWPERTRERLVDAATELFVRQGYAATTVDEIAALAGVTPRTFFRHFPDKEEVLFADDDRLLPLITATITASREPARADPLMREVLGVLAGVVEADRDGLRHRQRVIDADTALTGRELAKQAHWEREIASALRVRGFGEASSGLLAALGFALFRRVLHAWLAEDGGPSLRERVEADLDAVRVVLDEESIAAGT